MATRKMTAQERKWQAESDLRTLQQAEEIRSTPSRKSAAVQVAQQQLKALKTVTTKTASKPATKTAAKPADAKTTRGSAKPAAKSTKARGK